MKTVVKAIFANSECLASVYSLHESSLFPYMELKELSDKGAHLWPHYVAAYT